MYHLECAVRRPAGRCFTEQQTESIAIMQSNQAKTHSGDVFGGVDTHKQTHAAAAVDSAGRLLDTAVFPADPAGYEQLLGWLESLGAVTRVGVEGTGSYGAGLVVCPGFV